MGEVILPDIGHEYGFGVWISDQASNLRLIRGIHLK